MKPLPRVVEPWAVVAVPLLLFILFNAFSGFLGLFVWGLVLLLGIGLQDSLSRWRDRRALESVGCRTPRPRSIRTGTWDPAPPKAGTVVRGPWLRIVEDEVDDDAAP